MQAQRHLKNLFQVPYLEDWVLKDPFNGLLQRLAIDWSQLVWINSESNSVIFSLQQCSCTSVHVLTGLDCMLQMQRYRMHVAWLLTLVLCR